MWATEAGRRAGHGRLGAGALPPGPRWPKTLQTAAMWVVPFAALQRFRRLYGKRFTVLSVGHPPLVFLSDPEEMRAATAAPQAALRPGEGGSAVEPIVGPRSFMLSDGPRHEAGRRATLAEFGSRAVQRHADMVERVARCALADLPLDRPVALHPRMRALTLEVVLRTLTGRFSGPLDGDLALLHRGVLDMLDVTASPAFVEARLRRLPGARAWQRFLRSRRQVDELLYPLIEQHRHSCGEPLGTIGTFGALCEPDGRPAPAARVRDDVMSLILAGHETTSSQLAWAFQLLAHTPEVCARLTRELRRGEGEAYLTATVQEVLRRRCVFVFAIPRQVVAPIQIGEWTYDPGIQILPCIYLLHHDPALYPQPHAFRPERFLDAPPDPRVWMPWGGGRKRCPGLHLATLEMKLVVRALLERVAIEPASARLEHARWRSVIVTPHAGGRVVLRGR